MGIIQKIFGTRSEREVKKLMPLVTRIESMEDEMKALTDEQLREKTDEFRKRYQGGEDLDDLLPEAFAVCREAAVYLQLVFAGLICCFLYNYYASMLRSCGNSRTPFVILLVSSTLHALLDVLFVGVLAWGIRGVACSTVLCQAFSAAWCILYAERRCPPLTLKRSELRFERRMGGMVLSYAWAAALQQAVVCIGRLLVQGMLTPLGTNTVTGYNMSLRIEQFLFCFSQGVSAAMVVCLSQNLGHGCACGASTASACAWRPR